jgi:hypothetical protein
MENLYAQDYFFFVRLKEWGERLRRVGHDEMTFQVHFWGCSLKMPKK